MAAGLPGGGEVVRCAAPVQAAVLDATQLVQRHQQELVVAVRVLDQHIAPIHRRLHLQAVTTRAFGPAAVTLDQPPQRIGVGRRWRSTGTTSQRGQGQQQQQAGHGTHVIGSANGRGP
ncbi:hypothetical protein G6F24_014007 [Rhizopus arrhizus]|nr:hypothetical protein G6F24_014007 [Rhizopus arrhizus]